DLRASNRLAVSDHRERLERGGSELGRAHREVRPLDGLGVHRACEDLVAPGELHQLDTVRLEIVMLANLLQRDPHLGESGIGGEGRASFAGERANGAEERRLKQLGEWRHGRSPWGRRRRTARCGASPAWRAREAPAGSTTPRQWWDAARAPRSSRTPGAP